MALSEFEIKRVEKAIDGYIQAHRPPPHMRNELDLAFRLSEQSVVIYEIRPDWNSPSQKMESPIAKATYAKNQNIWKIYWMRADLKWHSYPPAPRVKTIEEFLALVEKDEHACFFG